MPRRRATLMTVRTFWILATRWIPKMLITVKRRMSAGADLGAAQFERPVTRSEDRRRICLLQRPGQNTRDNRRTRKPPLRWAPENPAKNETHPVMNPHTGP